MKTMYIKPCLLEEMLQQNDVMTASGENLEEAVNINENRTVSVFGLVD